MSHLSDWPDAEPFECGWKCPTALHTMLEAIQWFITYNSPVGAGSSYLSIYFLTILALPTAQHFEEVAVLLSYYNCTRSII
jgi:hypothetical protein